MLVLVAGSISGSGFRNGGVGTSLVSLFPNLVINESDVVVFDRGNNMIRILPPSRIIYTSQATQRQVS